uniref:Uncharacterized protein n=1 Tax=Chromera velia CCMP2878 TaxID=1169474 RepID=A0A0G4FTI4_9ALVE|eukprot:Cvel_18712.t1-p1 / transcript=Cvel_18712.t1 / gene=Cvel_18712 / organism=Chromera_velia_CCMP2878 / gene_product=hypothetical protein / transcript_product=hypothetical protein / location=Cvel_scaffold1568:20144-21516(+) / protein_length=338 / sequence_SO=supercontig / SO=protein_coding / is_pseudo=false
MNMSPMLLCVFILLLSAASGDRSPTERQLQGAVGDCYVVGKAPFCNASCSNCAEGDTCASSNYLYGAKCWSGSKVLCCKASSGRLLQAPTTLPDQPSPLHPPPLPETLSEAEMEKRQSNGPGESTNKDPDTTTEGKEKQETEADAHEEESRKLQNDNCYVIGSAPFCQGKCSDCNGSDSCVNSDYYYGARCWSGKKVLCCTSGSSAGRVLLESSEVPPETEKATEKETESGSHTDSQKTHKMEEAKANKESKKAETDHAVPFPLLSDQEAAVFPSAALRSLQQPGDGCYVVGASPFCAGKCSQCTSNGDTCADSNYKWGAQCLFGKKVLCCKASSSSG